MSRPRNALQSTHNRFENGYTAGQVDAETLDQLYFYRLWNIWANQRIVEDKLQNNSLKKYWKRLMLSRM